MLRRIIILVVLSSILSALVLIRNHTVTPVNNTTMQSKSSSGYITVEYQITSINGDQYYGKSDNGTKIHFSATKILSGEKIQVHDKVVCYFEKNDLGKGLVKVEKK